MNERLPFNPPQLQNYLDACWIEGYFSPAEVAQISERYEEGLKKEAEVSTNAIPSQKTTSEPKESKSDIPSFLRRR